MLQSQLNRMAELAFIRSLPDMIKDRKNMKSGRLKNLYTKLQQEVDFDLRKLPRPDAEDMAYLRNKFDEFGKETGWQHKDKHVITIISYVLTMLENSVYNHNIKIMETLNKIVEYMERGKDLRQPCCVAGALAADKWEKIMNEEYKRNY